MGEVFLVMRVLPDGPGNVQRVREGLEALKPARLEEEPLAFGMVAFRFTVMIPDTGGEQDRMENRVSSLPGVSSVEVIQASRAM
jgi:translation elongation factor aEF-1 beta